MKSIKKKLIVTLEKEIEVELTSSVFGEMTEEEYLAEFRSGLWHVNNIDDVVKYAASVAALNGGGMQHDGLGKVEPSHIRDIEKADVYYDIIDEGISVEII